MNLEINKWYVCHEDNPIWYDKRFFQFLGFKGEKVIIRDQDNLIWASYYQVFIKFAQREATDSEIRTVMLQKISRRFE